MTNTRSPGIESIYEIRVMGRLDPSWSDWFDGLHMTYMGGETVLMGAITDQAALLGILTKIAHLNLALLSVRFMSNQGEY